MTPKDKSKIGCRFHWSGGWKKGRHCEFSHEEKHKPRGRSGSRGSKGTSRAPSSDRVCHSWKKSVISLRTATPLVTAAGKGEAKPKKAAPAILTGSVDESESEAEGQPLLEENEEGRIGQEGKRPGSKKVRFSGKMETLTFPALVDIPEGAPRSQTHGRRSPVRPATRVLRAAHEVRSRHGMWTRSGISQQDRRREWHIGPRFRAICHS